MNVETLAKEYHEICREMVNKQIGMITKPTQPYLEWDELTESQKDGRRFIAAQLLKQYYLLYKAENMPALMPNTWYYIRISDDEGTSGINDQIEL